MHFVLHDRHFVEQSAQRQHETDKSLTQCTEQCCSEVCKQGVSRRFIDSCEHHPHSAYDQELSETSLVKGTKQLQLWMSPDPNRARGVTKLL